MNSRVHELSHTPHQVYSSEVPPASEKMFVVAKNTFHFQTRKYKMEREKIYVEQFWSCQTSYLQIV